MSVRECTRCSATNKKGGRCSRNTCKYFDMCWQHTRANKGLYLAESSIPGSGTGVFTLRAIKKNAKIADYTGQLVSNQGWNDGGTGDYGVQLNKREVLDARSTQTALGRYANDCRPRNRKNRHCKLNARFSINHHNKTVTLKATKNIPANSEIFVSYGKEYWA